MFATAHWNADSICSTVLSLHCTQMFDVLMKPFSTRKVSSAVAPTQMPRRISSAMLFAKSSTTHCGSRFLLTFAIVQYFYSFNNQNLIRQYRFVTSAEEPFERVFYSFLIGTEGVRAPVVYVLLALTYNLLYLLFTDFCKHNTNTS